MKREKQLIVPVSPELHLLIKRAAHRRESSMARYVREVLTADAVRVLDAPVEPGA